LNRDFLGTLSTISGIMARFGYSELFVNGSRGVYAALNGRTLPVKDLTLPEVAILANQVRLFARSNGLRLDALNPFCGGTIRDFDLRWHAVVCPATTDEIVLSVRRHKFHDLTLESFNLSVHNLELLNTAVANMQPILVAGPTGSGKTSFLTSILKKWHFQKRVLIAEAVAEIPVLSPQWISLFETHANTAGNGRVSIKQIAREALRLRPEVFVVGELRGSEADVFFDLNFSGHGGVLGTIHGDSVAGVRARLKRMLGKHHQSLWPSFNILMVFMKDTEVVDLAMHEVTI